MNEMDFTPENSTNAATPRTGTTRITKQQKAMLQYLMNNNPSLMEGTFTQDFSHNTAQLLWLEIATELNSIPGARKTWMQWKRTWTDMKRNSEKSQYYDNDMHISNDQGDDAQEDDAESDDEEIRVKRTRDKSISKAQKKLLYGLVNSNEKLQRERTDESTISCLMKQKEWKKIAVKLNSVTGPQKTWSQWKKCWDDLKKYYIHGDGIGKIFNPVEDNVEMCVDADITIPSATQLNRMVKDIIAQPVMTSSNIWMTLSNTLNAIGPCMKNSHEWKNIWMEYKRNVQKFVDRNGAASCDNLQRLTYEYIERERNESLDSTLTQHQLQLLKQTANQECNVVGSLVAVKLRSMQKEQKLIAEKLISEILFQGQMEMFQYSDTAVHIPGYM